MSCHPHGFIHYSATYAVAKVRSCSKCCPGYRKSRDIESIYAAALAHEAKKGKCVLHTVCVPSLPTLSVDMSSDENNNHSTQVGLGADPNERNEVR